MVESNVSNQFKSMLNDSAYRNEFKYVLPELLASQIDAYIQPFMNPDPFGKVYTVHSLYLDSPDLRLFHDSDTGKKNRFKLRLRTYGSSDTQPIHFEIKERMDRVIRKFRSKVDRNHVMDLISHVSDLPSDSLNESSPQLELFMQYAKSVGTHPTAMVSYERTAYVSAFGDETRITFDRNIRSFSVNDYTDDVWQTSEIPYQITHGDVVLEIKTGDTVPQWVNEMIQHFHITRRSYSKYVIGIKGLQSIGSIRQETAS